MRIDTVWIAVVVLGFAMAHAAAQQPVGGDRVEFKLDRLHLLDQKHLESLLPYGLGPIEPLFHRRAADLAASHAQAARALGPSAPHLEDWRTISLGRIPSDRRAAVGAKLAAALAALPGVACAEAPPAMEPAVLAPGTSDDACPIRTPLYDTHQAYLAPAPVGIDVGTAWEVPGGRGQGVWFADVEGAWNARHEDIPGNRLKHVAGEIVPDRGWEAHGTAVMGVVASRDNRLGMIGIAPNVERLLTGSIGGIGTTDAIDRTAAALRPGDVLLIELHGPGPRSWPGGGQKGYVPVEWWQATYDVIRTHTARGIVIVEAAGNGGENLDDPVYQGRFARPARNSGALMVGAGAPATAGFVDRSRLDFSNYGARVDLQGYGRMVATLDYGDLQGCGEAGRKYTGQFSGTSSASPIVAGAAVLVQAIFRERTGGLLPPAVLADLLIRTGSPQTDGPHGPASQHIGPRPDLKRALAALGVPTALRPSR